jgi:cell division protein FtsB
MGVIVVENFGWIGSKSIAVDISSKEFKAWLKQGQNFRYECDYGNVTIICDKQGNWTASKKVNQRLRRKRIGKAKDINLESLKAVTRLLCSNDHWSEYKAELRAKRKPKQNELEDMIAKLDQVVNRQKQTIQELKQKITDLSIELAQYKYAPEDDF